MIEWIAAGLALLGALLVLIAGLGILRFPDLYTRMHAATKASSLGMSLLLLAVALRNPEAMVWLKVLCGILFLFLTAPIAAHLLGRAAYVHKVPLWEGTVVDEIAGSYSDDHTLLQGMQERSRSDNLSNRQG
jgi:multicomponent Na+:H+ antiporter subunit G